MDRESAKKKIENLREEIEHHNKLYYDDSENIISDYEYDLKMNELISLEKKFPEFSLSTSPSLKVGGKITKDFKTFKHSTQMLSLSNTYSDVLLIVNSLRYVLNLIIVLFSVLFL